MSCRLARRLRHRLGQRGPFLAFMGVGKVAWGVGMIATPSSTAGLSLLTGIAPLHCWAWIWVLAGATTFTCAWLRFGQDRWGFIAASTPPALWAFAYLWGALGGHYERGLWIFLWYMTSHCGVIWCASRVPPDARRSKERAAWTG